MNKLEKVFENNKAFIPFITIGDPDLETSLKLLIEMSRSGADIIELGLPFSDPIAEGPVILKADERALDGKHRTTTDDVFEVARKAKEIIDTPLVIMTYINPIYVYGKEKFFNKCAEVGISGVIVPDEPFEEKDELRESAKIAGVTIINMIAPTSEERVKKIAEDAEGFIYLVSSLGTTGVRTSFSDNIEEMVKQIKKITKTPVAIGFGISTSEQCRSMCSFADGAIVGSAIVRIIADKKENSVPYVAEYVKEMKKAALGL